MAGNSNSGRPRKPKAVLGLYGTYRKDRHGERFDDSGLPTEIEKPSGLSDLASEFWDQMVPQLSRAGFAKSLDAPELFAMCEWWARWRICMGWLRHRQNRESFDGPNEVVELIAKVQAMANRSWAAFASIAGKFGLTPSDRAKLIAEPAKDVDEFEEFLKKKAT